jgi:hypothetical protein
VADKADAQRRKLIIHLKTAKALGIDVRSTLLATADVSSNNSAHVVFWHISELALRLTWVCEAFQSRH